MAWLQANLSTIIIGLVLLFIVIIIVKKLYTNKKEGKSSCSCGDGCGGCASAGICHDETVK